LFFIFIHAFFDHLYSSVCLVFTFSTLTIFIFIFFGAIFTLAISTTATYDIFKASPSVFACRAIVFKVIASFSIRFIVLVAFIHLFSAISIFNAAIFISKVFFSLIIVESYAFANHVTS